MLSNCIVKMLKQLQVARGSEVASGIFKEDFHNYGLSLFFHIVKNATTAYLSIKWEKIL